MAGWHASTQLPGAPPIPRPRLRFYPSPVGLQPSLWTWAAMRARRRVSELPGSRTPPKARWFAVSVGTDQYDDKSIAPLHFAKTDANNFARGLKTLQGVAYSKVEIASLLDARGLQSALPAKIRELVARAGEQDTIMLFASGHGVRDASTGRFYLVTRDTRRGRVTETSISWTEIALALDGAKARVFVLLDACQSGSAIGGSNDDAVAALLGRKASITVIAAAKGRQDSLEFGTGGAFTTALVRAITEHRKATDTDRRCDRASGTLWRG